MKTQHEMQKIMEKNLDKSLFRGKDLGLVNLVVNYLHQHDISLILHEKKNHHFKKYLLFATANEDDVTSYKEKNIKAIQGFHEQNLPGSKITRVFEKEVELAHTVDFTIQYKVPGKSNNLINLYFF